jgi:hypothetical protein
MYTPQRRRTRSPVTDTARLSTQRTSGPCGTKRSAAQAQAAGRGRGHAQGRGYTGQAQAHGQGVHRAQTQRRRTGTRTRRQSPGTDTARAQYTSHIVFMSSQPRSNSASVGMDVRSSLRHEAQRGAGACAGGRQGARKGQGAQRAGESAHG